MKTHVAILFPTILVAISACGHAAMRPAIPAAALTSEAPGMPAAATQASAPGRICVRMIEVKWSGVPGAAPTVHRTEDQARIRAEMIANSAADPTSHFEELAHNYGDAAIVGTTCETGKLVTRGDGTLDANVEATAFGLTVNEVAAPVRTAHGFVVLMRGPDTTAAPTEISACHILISFHGASGATEAVTRTREEALVLAQAVATQARAPGADWDALVRQHSDEPQAAERQGDLGRFGHGRMVRAFERAAFALNVGEISEVVETNFGFHVIHRYE